MLERSFVQLPGIGETRERRLWERGILHWDALESSIGEVFRDPAKAEAALEELDRSRLALARQDLYYFYRKLPRDQLWRLIPGNIDHVAYLDIESTGLGFPPASESTTITFYHRGQILQEHQREKKALLIRKVLSECKILCTFFGEAFDVPFLRAELGIPFEVAHVDLCFWLKRLGHKGGLKLIQKRFPAEIPSRLSLDLDGYDAVRLWRLHLRGVEGALETLLTYNAEDTVVLEPLLAIAYNLEASRRPELELPQVSVSPMARVATGVSLEVYRALRGDAEKARSEDAYGC